MKSYFAPGKILLAGEYAVMAGLEALALPVKAGQWMKVWDVPSPQSSRLIWEAHDAGGAVWFSCRIDTDIMHVTEATDEETAHVLLRLCLKIRDIRPEFFSHRLYRIETETEFDRNWGLGTSSTLVQLLADWCTCSAFELQKEVFGGSGYDVAVALTGKPLVYWLENNTQAWQPWSLDPGYTGEWYLMFPGEKQNSRHSLQSVSQKIDEISRDKLLHAQLDMVLQGIKNPVSHMMLEASIELWQGMLAQILGLPRAYEDLGISPVKGGVCKWLGAWGGDVLLVNKTILDAWPDAFSGMESKLWNEFIQAH